MQKPTSARHRTGREILDLMMDYLGLGGENKSKRAGKLADHLDVPPASVYNWRTRNSVPDDIIMLFCSKHEIPLNDVLYVRQDEGQSAGLVQMDGPAPTAPIRNLGGGEEIEANNSQLVQDDSANATPPPSHGVVASRRVRAYVHGPSLSRMDTRDNVDRFMSDRTDVAMFFRVMDDALYGVGIMANDMIVVDPSCTPQHGDVVVAQLPDGQLIVRKLEPPYLVSYGGDALTSRSEDYLYPGDDVTIVGVVVSFARRIH